MTVVELLRVMDNPNLTEPQQQIINIYTSWNGGYWEGTINEFLCKYDSGYYQNYQNLGNAKVLKLTHTDYMGEFEPVIVVEDF